MIVQEETGHKGGWKTADKRWRRKSEIMRDKDEQPSLFSHKVRWSTWPTFTPLWKWYLIKALRSYSSQEQPAVLLYEEGRERGWRREKGWAGMYGECQMSSIHGSRFQVVLWKLTASRFSVPTYGDSWEQRFEGCRLTSNIFYNADQKKQSWLCLPWTQDVMGRKGGLNERRGRKLNKKRGEGSNDNLPERTKHMYITESEWFCCCISKNDIWDLEELNYKTTQSVFNYAFISKPDEVASRGPTAHRV